VSRPTHAPARRVRSRWRRLVAWLWSGWEWAFSKLFRLYQVPGAGDGVLRFGFRRWRGPAVRLGDGTVVRRGDWVAEVHIVSPQVLARGDVAGTSLTRLVFVLSAQMRSALQALAREIESGRLKVPIVALYGKTLLHRGAARLGFEVHDLPAGLGSRLLAAYERWLVALYHPLAPGAGAMGERVKMVWLSTGALLRRFGEAAPTMGARAGAQVEGPAWYTAPGDPGEGAQT